MKFDPESYTITIRKEDCDGEILYVGRVAEFPNISAFEETFNTTRALIIDSIQALKKIADESQADFPFPYPAPSDEFSGRVTLRLSRSLHAKVSRIAAQEDISVNQYLVTAIATYAGESDGIAKVVLAATNMIRCMITNAVTAVTEWNPNQSFQLNQFLFSGVTPIYPPALNNMQGSMLLEHPMATIHQGT